MARPRVDNKIEIEIERLHREKPKWKSPRVRGELYKKYGEKAPSESHIRNKIHDIDNPEPSPLDESWSLASLTRYPVPYDILPTLVTFANTAKVIGIVFSIRWALWIARLSVLSSEDKGELPRIDENIEQWKNRFTRYNGRLLLNAWRYCVLERAIELLKLPPLDSSEIDSISLEQTEQNLIQYLGNEKLDVKNKRFQTKLINDLGIAHFAIRKEDSNGNQ